MRSGAEPAPVWTGAGVSAGVDPNPTPAGTLDAPPPSGRPTTSKRSESGGAHAEGSPTDPAPNRDAWLAWRRGGFGGSDVPKFLGLSSQGSAFTVWADKVGLLPATDPTPRQRLGLLLEPVVATLFHEQTGLYVVGEQTWCTRRDVPWQRCTVDGFAAESPSSDLEHVLGTHEIKTDARFHWPEVPVDIRAQCIWQMGVTGVRHCYLSVLHGGFTFEVYELPWDEDALIDWETMTTHGERLWFEHVLTGTPPPLDDSEATARALKTLYPTHVPGRRVVLDDLAALVDERAELKADEARIAKRLRFIHNTLHEAFGQAEVGTIEGAPVLTYRAHERKPYTVAGGTVRQFRQPSKADLEAASESPSAELWETA